ncbi:hypothetical protein ABT026_17520 [Streptomyces sp. NPDC002734]|uniref:hypothetical protein n=1 Tax=Streptomyces sp. NPDC002734 TaxID=3154426 RepID=UPI00332D199E
MLDEGQRLLPADRDKTRAVFLAYRAKSHLDLREPDFAAAAALEALTLSHRIGAPRCVQLVRELTPRFAPHAAVPGVAEVLAASRWSSPGHHAHGVSRQAECRLVPAAPQLRSSTT